jgi:hypothetical protein
MDGGDDDCADNVAVGWIEATKHVQLHTYAHSPGSALHLLPAAVCCLCFH